MSRKAMLSLECVLCMVALACGGSESDDGATAMNPQNGAAGMNVVSGSPAAGQGAAATTSPPAGGAGTSGQAPATGPGGSAMPPSTIAGAGSANGGAGGGVDPGVAGQGPTGPSDYDYANQAVTLTETLTIAAGQTVRVGPGTSFTAGANMQVLINGTLIVEGTAEAPVSFAGAGMPRSWGGIVIASGGSLKMTHATIGGATYGIQALAGSIYDVSYSEIGTSFKVAVLLANGTFDHMKLHASGDDTFSPVNEVSMDDVNGTLTIIDASPTVTHSSFDNSSPLVDMIRVGGNASPVFDHISVVGAHCGLHTNGGVNTSPTIKNSVLSGMSYGIMAYSSKPTFENCNFMDNSSDIGFCFDATADNAPTLKGNYYSSGSVSFDPSCSEIGKPDSAPASAPLQGIGPMGL